MPSKIVDMGRDDDWREFSIERFEAALRARVIGYELWAFATTVARVDTVDDVYLANNVVDACLVHARCCSEFLVGRVNRNGERSWKKADVRPLDFLDQWEPEPEWAVDVLDAHLPLLDKHVVHVTIARADLFDHRWNVDALDRAVHAVAVAFLAELENREPERFAELEPWFRYASETRGALRSDDPVAERSSVRSGLDLIMIPPRGVPLGAWAAWSQRYTREKGIAWPE